MVNEKVIIKNKSGIHARPAGVLAKTAMECESNVEIIFGEKIVNAKSILNLMAAGIKKGTEIEVCCDGKTEEADLQKVIEVIKSGLGEDD